MDIGTGGGKGAATRPDRHPLGTAGVALSLGLRLLSIGPLLILIARVIAIGVARPSFLKPVNIGNIAAQPAVIATLAMGPHLVILTRGIDLSVDAPHHRHDGPCRRRHRCDQWNRIRLWPAAAPVHLCSVGPRRKPRAREGAAARGRLAL